MIRYLYADELAREPALQRAMFRDRADQFHSRLGWDVTVDANGEERDGYDAENPLYVLWQTGDGGHGGSMRFLPTTGPTMVNDHFGHLTGGGRIESPLIWECTRFCLSRGASGQVAAALMLAGGEILRNFGLRHLVGVFDARMVRIYRRIGASPELLGREGEGRGRVSVGLWAFSETARAEVACRAGISPAQSAAWFEQAFGAPAQAVGA
ncbi:acyl-homoserine-lactone synthase [Marinovum sp.]|uniref:acyl-homoserine-lactone synthase n=1 Tax=Marinovum sp. TaxID=2024839 RepID=UPI002B270960|nr:acyl-homoserine-lactone synthase [Marinovum sp.]